ncbi:MAG: hypothetical protein WBC91_03705 [Phototrophicaceae bacterium]
MMNRILEITIARFKNNAAFLWMLLTLLTMLTIIGPVLAEGATGSSG